MQEIPAPMLKKMNIFLPKALPYSIVRIQNLRIKNFKILKLCIKNLRATRPESKILKKLRI